MATHQTTELSLIYQIHQKVDYNNLNQLKLIYNKIQSQNMLNSSIGLAYKNKMLGVIKDNDDGTCLFCKGQCGKNVVICDACDRKLDAKIGQKTVTPAENPSATLMNNTISSTVTKAVEGDAVATAVEMGKTAIKFADKGVKTFANKVNELAGGEGEVELRFKDFFSEIFKKHSSQDAEKIFICGTSLTTPDEKYISSEWPRPWLYSRVMVLLFASFYLLMMCWTMFGNYNVIPDIIFVGSCIMPVTVLIFFFEINVPRNLSIFTTIKVFFVGGAASLIVTLLLFEVFPVGELNYGGAIVVGFVEEVGKAVIVVITIKKTNRCKYIFNGLLLGGAVGAGFAAFESAGYAFNIYLSSNGAENAYNNMVHNIYLRGFLSPGGHVAWAAITGAAIMISLGGRQYNNQCLKDKRFISMFAMSIIMHAIWDCPLTVFGSELLKIVILIVMAWIILAVIIHNALGEVNKRVSILRIGQE